MHPFPLHKTLKVLIFAGSLWILASCQTIKELFGFGVQQPKVTVLSMAVRKFSLAEIDLLIQLKADNPNSFDLEFNSLAYQVSVDETALAHGEYTSSIKIPEESSLKIDLPLKISTQNAFAVIQKFLAAPNQETKLNFSALVQFKSPVGPIEFEFNDTRPLLKP